MPLGSVGVLVAEHRKVENALNELESLIDDLLTTSEVPDSAKQAFGNVVDFLGRDLGRHIKKEDLGLFPFLEKFLPRDSGPLAVMSNDHTEATRLYLGLSKGVTELYRHPSADGQAAAQIRDHGRSLIQLLRSHLLKEERILFPFAESHLSEEDDREVLRQFESVSATPAAQ